MQPPRSYCLASFYVSLGFVVVLSVACGKSANGDDDDAPAMPGGHDAVGADQTGGTGGSTSSNGGSGGMPGSPDASAPTTMKDAGPGNDTGNDDKPDAGDQPSADAGEADAGPALNGVGSCCAEHDTPGCSNADLQVCVCELLPSCCTDKWEAACTYLVQQKYCQEGVRDCVCGTDTNADPKQWGLTGCCKTDWSSMCDDVAEIKCGALAGCF